MTFPSTRAQRLSASEGKTPETGRERQLSDGSRGHPRCPQEAPGAPWRSLGLGPVFGALPQQSREEMEVLFTLLSERYERGSVLVSSNLPFSKWEQIFKDVSGLFDRRAAWRVGDAGRLSTRRERMSVLAAHGPCHRLMRLTRRGSGGDLGRPASRLGRFDSATGRAIAAVVGTTFSFFFAKGADVLRVTGLPDVRQQGL